MGTNCQLREENHSQGQDVHVQRESLFLQGRADFAPRIYFYGWDLSSFMEEAHERKSGEGSYHQRNTKRCKRETKRIEGVDLKTKQGAGLLTIVKAP